MGNIAYLTRIFFLQLSRQTFDSKYLARDFSNFQSGISMKMHTRMLPPSMEREFSYSNVAHFLMQTCINLFRVLLARHLYDARINRNLENVNALDDGQLLPTNPKFRFPILKSPRDRCGRIKVGAKLCGYWIATIGVGFFFSLPCLPHYRIGRNGGGPGCSSSHEHATLVKIKLKLDEVRPEPGNYA